MPNRKKTPSWKRTQIEWEPEVVIWERFAKGATDKQVFMWLELQSGSNGIRPLDIETIANVRKDLDELPEYLAKTLPEVIYSYWLSLRKSLVVPTIVEGIYDILPEPPKAQPFLRIAV